jgi:hypothetical protein
MKQEPHARSTKARFRSSSVSRAGQGSGIFAMSVSKARDGAIIPIRSPARIGGRIVSVVPPRPIGALGEKEIFGLGNRIAHALWPDAVQVDRIAIGFGVPAPGPIHDLTRIGIRRRPVPQSNPDEWTATRQTHAVVPSPRFVRFDRHIFARVEATNRLCPKGYAYDSSNARAQLQKKQRGISLGRVFPHAPHSFICHGHLTVSAKKT